MNAAEPVPVTAEQPEQLETICAAHLDVEVGDNGVCETARLIRVVGEPIENPCVPAVLVPVTQRQAERDAMKQAFEALRDLRAFEQRHAAYEGGGFLVLHVREWADRAIDALAAVQGIPVDTEAGNGE